MLVCYNLYDTHDRVYNMQLVCVLEMRSCSILTRLIRNKDNTTNAELRIKKRSSNNPGRPLRRNYTTGTDERGACVGDGGLSLFVNFFPTQGHHGRTNFRLDRRRSLEKEKYLLFINRA